MIDLNGRSPKFLVIGDLIVDHYLWGSCKRISPEAPVQVVNVNNESMSAVVAGTSPKKAVGKISAAAAPYKKKSYHSMLVPARAVSATFLMLELT